MSNRSEAHTRGISQRRTRSLKEIFMGRIELTSQDLSQLVNWVLISQYPKAKPHTFLLQSKRDPSVGMLVDDQDATNRVKVIVKLPQGCLRTTATCVCGSCYDGFESVRNAADFLANEAEKAGLTHVITRHNRGVFGHATHEEQELFGWYDEFHLTVE